MALTTFKFKKGREQRDGLAGYLGAHLRAYGTATVPSGAQTIAVSDTDIAATDIVIGSPLTVGATPAYITGITISAATSFTFSVSADPSTGGCVIAYIVIRP